MQKLLDDLGQVSAIIGAQWGDEGKGKVTDILSEHFDVIARACGGANAGHTIVVNGQKHVFHLLPSGCLHEGKPVILGAGMVIHLPTLLEEIATLKDAGVDIVPRLFIDKGAQVLFDYHKEIDASLEEKRSKTGKKIGTTKRGIGPAYMEKAMRTGIRMESITGSYADILAEKKQLIEEMFDVSINLDLEVSQTNEAATLLGKNVVNASEVLMEHHSGGKTILIEGAQATLLDTDHGTYPYVTSSSTTASGALQGLGLPPKSLTSCIGVAKAYCTRVGEGDFITELDGQRAEELRERGGEYGATTGRPRRCGWLHIPDLMTAARINGYSHWNITKLDVLDAEETIPVGIGVNADGTAQYEELPGWQESTVGMTEFSQLPANAQKYIEFIEERTGVPAGLIGTGQGREEMIVR